MVADEYSFEGYPVSEVKTRYGLKPYRIEDYEERSIDEVRAMLARKRGYTDVETIEQHLSFMESLAKKLNLILASEEREGIMNLELRQCINDIKNCCVQLTSRQRAIKESEIY
ncbi:hypothetical protein HYV82_02570 [Candidatus Woesearchaeota archaeon]|nr:hypothetical protein [Candidatus Woesearchaeota archaeon]